MATQSDDSSTAGAAPADRSRARSGASQTGDAARDPRAAHGLTQSQAPHLRERQDAARGDAPADGDEVRVRSGYVRGDGGNQSASDDGADHAAGSAWNRAEAREANAPVSGLREPLR
jgi:hypothetical protein